MLRYVFNVYEVGTEKFIFYTYAEDVVKSAPDGVCPKVTYRCKATAPF